MATLTGSTASSASTASASTASAFSACAQHAEHGQRRRRAPLAVLGVLGAAAAMGALGGCATISESNQQVLMVRTIQDNREIAGAGCVLTNDAGRWFVTSPGRVTVHRSPGNLFVDCRKQGVSAGQDIVASKANTSAVLGNAVLTAGLGYLLDRRTGAGFDYPETLTVLMRPVRPDAGQEAAAPVGTPVY